MTLWAQLRGPVQIAFAVDDVVAAARSWVARGAGPFLVRHHIEVEHSRMRGVPVAFDHSSAYGQWGDVMVELICEHHDEHTRIGPLAGVHHMAFFVDNVSDAQASLAENGWPESLYATAGDTAFAMHDATADLGHLVEVYEDTERLLGFYSHVRSLRAGWDGSDPIRVL